MAAIRLLQTRLRLSPSLIPSSHRRSLLLPRESASELLPAARSLLGRNDYSRKGFQTHSNPTSQANKELENPVTDSLKPVSNSLEDQTKQTAFSNLKTSPRHDLAMLFTCRVCETRSVKTFCRESYEKGVVVAKCGGCNNFHLLADHLGWFGEPGRIEDLLAARGEEVKKGSVDTLNLTLADLAGTEAFSKLK